MPNWRAIRTLTLWALAADPSDTQTTAANSTAPHRARRKLRPVKAPSRPACFGSPAVRFRSGMLHPCIIFDPHRVAQVGTGADGRVRHCDTRRWRVSDAPHPSSALRLLQSHMIVGRMAGPPLSDREHLTICFAHVAYRLCGRLRLPQTRIQVVQALALARLQ